MSEISRDQIHRFVLDPFDLRGEILSLDESYQLAIAHQSLPPIVKCLLGEFIAATGLIIDTFKRKGTLTLQARGSGPVPLIMAEAHADGSVRGIAKLAEGDNIDWNQDADLPTLIGEGVLSLTFDPDKGQRYQGIVALEGHNLAAALTNYFNQSEQLPTQVWLYASETFAGGLLLQGLPDQKATQAENQDAWQTATTLAETLTLEELSTLGHDETLIRLFNEFETRLFPPSQFRFHCPCSRERSGQALVSIGRSDAEALIAERDIIEIGCDFCGTKYTFATEDLDAIFGGPDPLH